MYSNFVRDYTMKSTADHKRATNQRRLPHLYNRSIIKAIERFDCCARGRGLFLSTRLLRRFIGVQTEWNISRQIVETGFILQILVLRITGFPGLGAPFPQIGSPLPTASLGSVTDLKFGIDILVVITASLIDQIFEYFSTTRDMRN